MTSFIPSLNFFLGILIQNVSPFGFHYHNQIQDYLKFSNGVSNVYNFYGLFLINLETYTLVEVVKNHHN